MRTGAGLAQCLNEGGRGFFLEGRQAHAGLEPDVGRCWSELLVIGVEERLDALAFWNWVRGMFQDAREDRLLVRNDGRVAFTPVGGGDPVGSEFNGVVIARGRSAR